MDKEKTKRFVNDMFEKGGDKAIQNFAGEFTDATKFQRLFNIMFDEKLDCGIQATDIESECVENWRKINGK